MRKYVVALASLILAASFGAHAAEPAGALSPEDLAKVQETLTSDPGSLIRITGSTTAESPFIMLMVENLSPVALKAIKITPIFVTNTGRIVGQRSFIRVRPTIEAGQQRSINSGLSNLTSDQMESLRFRVDSAEIAK